MRTKLLFVCARNKIRSVTAERILSGSALYEVRSRGLARGSRVRLTAGDLGWADQIFVMEKDHKDRLREGFAAALGRKPVTVLYIEDVYKEAMDPALQEVLRERLAQHLEL